MDNSQVANLLAITCNNFALSFGEELRFLQKLDQYNCLLQKYKAVLHKSYAYICRNIVLLTKVDMRSSDNFDNTIHQSHNFLNFFKVRLGLHRLLCECMINIFLMCIPQIQKPYCSTKLQDGDYSRHQHRVNGPASLHHQLQKSIIVTI
jgi:hypothetical protein